MLLEASSMHVGSDIGLELIYANNLRLHLAHHEIMTQGRMVEDALRAVHSSEEKRVRYEELKWATDCRGLSTPMFIFEYTDASTFLEYHIDHCMALGFDSQVMKQMHDVVGADEFNNACRRADKRSRFILHPSIIKPHMKRMLFESNLNLLSGYKVEYHQHAMECFPLLLFHGSFHRGPERNLFRCPLKTFDKVYYIYWRFFPCTIFLFRGANKTVLTSNASQQKLENKNKLIEKHRRIVDAHVDVLCKLFEKVIGPDGCSPNLHISLHMIR
jgi:hypothetical protein